MKGRSIPVLPTELMIVAEQLRRRDGRFRFKLAWKIAYHRQPGEGMSAYYDVRGKQSLWSAGSIEEMLVAIEAAELAVEATAGVRREISLRSWQAQVNRCSRCGQLRRWPHDHPLAQCVKALEQAKQSISGVGRWRPKR